MRGRVLIHAAKGMTQDEYDDVVHWLNGTIELPLPRNLPRGGIVGHMEIVDCVRASSSKWFVGPFGFVLRNACPLLPTPLRGQLGFFDVPVPRIFGDGA